VLDVAHAANASTEPLAWYAARRLNDAFRRTATWWLLEDDTGPVSSLLAYPLSLRFGGDPLRGYGLGSVATRPSAQRRGYAAALCAQAGEASAAPVGVLFSAIPPRLYTSLGFRVMPAFQFACSDVAALAASGPHAPLRPIDPLAELPLLRATFDATQDGLRIARDAAAWLASLNNNPEDRFFAVAGGTLRLVDAADGVEVVELFSDAPAAALRSVAALVQQRGGSSLSGWFAPPGEVVEHFEAQSRERTLPMVRGPAEIITAWLSVADYF